MRLLHRLLLVIVVVLAYALGAGVNASLAHVHFGEFTLVARTDRLLLRYHLFLLLDLLNHRLALQVVRHHTLLGGRFVAPHFLSFVADKAHFGVLGRLCSSALGATLLLVVTVVVALLASGVDDRFLVVGRDLVALGAPGEA